MRDESISVIRFRTTAKGNLTHLYYIFYNLDPLETEFNTVSCYSTGALLLIEVHRGKEGTKNSKYCLHIGANESCTKIMTEATKG